jgi:hypothetical protein
MSAFAALRTATRSARLPRSRWAATPSSGLPSIIFSRPKILPSRLYSTEEKPAEQSPKAEETQQNASASEHDKDDSSAQSEEQMAIAAKDAEILDLTVRRLSSCFFVAGCAT